eukprot:11217728-Lingulodinium_polyedra.AAC.1
MADQWTGQNAQRAWSGMTGIQMLLETTQNTTCALRRSCDALVPCCARCACCAACNHCALC